MKFPCRVTRLVDDRWALTHESAELGQVRVIGKSREEAAEKMIGELRYRLELCPCSGESFQFLDIEWIEAGG